MEKIKMEIKKELSFDEFEQLIIAFKEELHNNTDLDFLARALEIYIQEITPAKATYLFHLKDEMLLETVHNETKAIIDLSHSKGMIKRCILTQEPQLTNDIKRDIYYEEKTDNIFSYDLKNLLIMPLHDISNNIFAVIWIGIPQRDINQFIAKDLVHIQTLIDQISYVSPADTMQTKEEILEKKEEVSEKIEGTGKNTEIDPHQKDHHNKMAAPTLVRKIKSLFSRSNKKKV